MLNDIIEGIGAYLKALAQVPKYGLTKYFVFSAFLGLAVAVILGVIVYGYADNLGAMLGSLWIWDWGSSWIETVLSGLSAIGMLAIFFFLFRYIMFVALAPVLSKMSESIERSVYGIEAMPSSTNIIVDILRGLRIAVRNIIRELLLSALFLILGIVLPVFAFLVPVFIFFVQAYYAGFGNMDYSLERHFNARQSAAFVRRNRIFATANGSIFLLILLVPLLGILAAPFLGTLAATIPTLERIKALEGL